MRVTVGLPFSDQHEFLAAAIRSVLNQTYCDWRLLLVADGATSAALATARAVKDERVDLIVRPDRRGLAVRLNEIATLAEGEVLFRMDADDVMAPHRIGKQLEFLDQHPGIDLVGSRAYLIDELSTVQGRYVEADLPVDPAGYLNNGVFTHPTVAGRRDWFRENPYNEGLLLGQDKELWLRTFRHSSFAKLEEPLLFYRVQSTISRGKRMKSSAYSKKIVRELGPEHVGSRSTQRHLFRAWIKDALFVASSMNSRTSLAMYRRKCEELTADELNAANELFGRATAQSDATLEFRNQGTA